ncbi:capsular biosynthesis protein [Burkholderia latens]|nr:capsular biosynthesis protein [Burkholderia latens]
MLSIAVACGMRPTVAWRGPLEHAQRRARQWLSWFEHSVAEDTVPRSFIGALNDALDEDVKQFPSDIENLIDRVCATWIPHCSASADCTTRAAAQVVVIDERRWAHDPAYDSPASRPEAFRRMMEVARRHHPKARLLLVRSGDPGSGQWLSDSIEGVPSNVDVHDVSVLANRPFGHTSHVYTIGATEGLLALLRGAQVHVFGGPYYAGWGLTADYFPLCGRRHRPSVLQFFHAVFLQLARYLDPHTRDPGDIRSVLKSLELQHDIASRFSSMRDLAAVGIQRWKRPFVAPFLTAGGGRLRWANRCEPLTYAEHAVFWGAHDHIPSQRTATPIRIEDGFVHSLGLGSDIVAPCSQVIDARGIYFDPTVPNDLTEILNRAAFEDAELARAATLRESIVRNGITKYNLGRQRPSWTPPPGVKVVLVAGQVEDDASIRLGCPGIRSAGALLEHVRAIRPDAWLVYRPHPDVLARNRPGLIDASRIANIIDTQADIVSLIEVADEVHTLTSLAGFDALLRGKPVFTYGIPFYAGWGLTHDAITPIPHRERPLSLDMLTAGALLRYPVYWDWALHLFTTPEAVVEYLAQQAFRPLMSMRPSPIRIANRIRRWVQNTCAYFWSCRPGSPTRLFRIMSNL